MNKFAILAIVAFAACQLVAAAPTPEDDEEEGFSQAVAANGEDETSLLMGTERLFTDFCLEQRNYVIGDIRQNARGTSASLFKAFFGQFNEITDEVLNVEKDAVEQLAATISSPDSVVTDGPLPEDQVEALIEQGKREIASKNDVSYGLIPSAKAAISAVYSTINSAIFIRLAKARSMLSAQNLMAAIDANCNKVAQYESTLAENLAGAKEDIKHSAQDSETQAFIDSVTINSLHCQTTKNIVRLNAFCQLFKAGHGPFLKMLGINLPK